MLSFIQNWFGPKANPIGVDVGSDTLRMAQVRWVDKEPRLIAAASSAIPEHARQDFKARLGFMVDCVRDLLAQGGFQGRQAVLGLPASMMHIQHLRVPKMDESELKKSLAWEARGKLPIDPGRALLRHHVAGEVYADHEPRQEVILMAAQRSAVNDLLAGAARARLDVVGMNVEPKAVIDCFGHIYRRRTDAEATSAYIDIGAVGTRVTISRGNRMLFARMIPTGGDHFAKAVADELGIGPADARLLRVKLAGGAARLDEDQTKSEDVEGDGMALLRAGMGERRKDLASEGVAHARDEEARAVESACGPLLSRLIEELDLCRRYYEATFPAWPLDRMIFVGGEARQRMLCQQIARRMGLAAQVGDPLVRLGRTSDVGMDSGIDRRQPQPAWSVALGLSMGQAPVLAASEGGHGGTNRAAGQSALAEKESR